jgi:hypothetical protein
MQSTKLSVVNLREFVERVTGELASLLTAEIELRVSEALESLRSEAPGPGPGSSTDGRRAGRLCPVPGCGKPGAGPRNRWFCREHAEKLSVEEQKGILARTKRQAAEGKLPTEIPSELIVRIPPRVQRAHKPLDMSCRVEGCPNRSRGPRAGFICDQHRASMPPEEWEAAREAYNARKRAVAPPAEALDANNGSADDAKQHEALAVPPILRKAEVREA